MRFAPSTVASTPGPGNGITDFSLQSEVKLIREDVVLTTKPLSARGKKSLTEVSLGKCQVHCEIRSPVVDRCRMPYPGEFEVSRESKPSPFWTGKIVQTVRSERRTTA